MKESLDLNKMTIKTDYKVTWPQAIRDSVFMICLLIVLIVFLK